MSPSGRGQPTPASSRTRAGVRIRGDHPGQWRGEVKAGHLVGLAAVVTLATILVRLVFPFDSQKYVDLNLYQWPECVALFALGVMASGKGWGIT